MSLINQMLLDLQLQKKDDKPPVSKSGGRSLLKKIPCLPMPVLLSGVGVLLLAFLWWMAGVLSDMMFGFEQESQQVAVVEEVVTYSNPNVPAAKDQLTLAEREAEPPAFLTANKPEAEMAEAPVKVEIPQELLAVKVVTKKAQTYPKASPLKASVPKSVKDKAVKPKSFKRNQVKASEKVAAQTVTKVMATPPLAKPAKRLHLDEMPGAIRSQSSFALETPRIDRPGKISANTPYGLAEEAYLDGKWAYQRNRTRLAIRSLQEAMKLYPGHFPARVLLVKIFEEGSKNGEAMSLLDEGLEIAPDYLLFKKSYARLLSAQGDYDAAIKIMLSNGLPAVEEDPEAHVILASLYQRLDDSRCPDLSPSIGRLAADRSFLGRPRWRPGGTEPGAGGRRLLSKSFANGEPA